MHIFFALRGQNMQNSILVNTLIDFEQSILPNKHYKYNLTRVPQGTGFFKIHNLSIVPVELILKRNRILSCQLPFEIL